MKVSLTSPQKYNIYKYVIVSGEDQTTETKH